MVESQSASSLVAEGEEDDPEWEYEYHETETESFYVTLDISSTADYYKLGTKKTKPDQPQSRPPQPATSPGAQDNAGPSEPPETPAPEPPASMAIDPTLEQPEEDTSFSEHKDRIQILDLHTHNPLISYQNKLYSCEWTSTLGTDILLTVPTPDFPHPVLRENPNVSVLATSSIKLMGRPAQISSRHPTEEGAQTSSMPATESSTAAAKPASSLEKAPSAPPVKIPLGPIPTRARQNQANFLERLMAIKAKKGEKDNVTVYTQKANQGSGWRSQRRKASEALDMEDGEEYETTTQQSGRGKGSGGRPRGSRRTRGPRTAKGGLFRDYRPRMWDTPGADIRAGPSPTTTPESWDQLEDGASDGKKTPASASPLPAEPPAHRALSVSASASPTPPMLLPVQIETAHDISSSATAHTTLRSFPELQSAIVREDENEVPAPGVLDVEMEDV